MANDRPVTIEVNIFGRYTMIDPPTPRNAALFAVLKDEGGINASVPPGKYHFNALKKETGWVVTLDPV